MHTNSYSKFPSVQLMLLPAVMSALLLFAFYGSANWEGSWFAIVRLLGLWVAYALIMGWVVNGRRAPRRLIFLPLAILLGLAAVPLGFVLIEPFPIRHNCNGFGEGCIFQEDMDFFFSYLFYCLLTVAGYLLLALKFMAQSYGPSRRGDTAAPNSPHLGLSNHWLLPAVLLPTVLLPVRLQLDLAANPPTWQSLALTAAIGALNGGVISYFAKRRQLYRCAYHIFYLLMVGLLWGLFLVLAVNLSLSAEHMAFTTDTIAFLLCGLATGLLLGCCLLPPAPER